MSHAARRSARSTAPAPTRPTRARAPVRIARHSSGKTGNYASMTYQVGTQVFTDFKKVGDLD